MPDTNPQIPPCAICQQPLSGDELNLNRHWHFDCEVCTVCGQSMSGANTQIQNCIDHGTPVGHTVCLERDSIQRLRDRVIPVMIGDLETFNNEILTMKHSVRPPENDLTLLLELIKSAQDTAATASWLLKLTKAKIDIVRDRDNVEYEKERKQKSNKDKAEKAIGEQRTAERSAMLSAERQTPWLRDRRKSIESLVKNVGFTLEAATEMIDTKTREMGKDPLTGLPIQ